MIMPRDESSGSPLDDRKNRIKEALGEGAEPETPIGGIAPWLGGEFLLWLWWQAETTDGTFDLPDRASGEPSEPVALMLEEGLTLAGEPPAEGAGGCGVASLRIGAPAASAEAAAALLTGKLPKRMRLLLARGERQWSLSLNAETLDLASVKVPPPGADATEPEDVLMERLSGFAEAREIIEGLYAGFLGRRLGPPWEGEDVPGIRRWMHDKAAGVA